MVDLVFYNRLLRCFVLFNLKIGELKHQDIGQMQMYVHYYDRKVKLPDENPTIGIVLCRDKNNAVIEMTLPEDNTQIFASKYETILPSKEALQKLLEEQMLDEEYRYNHEKSYRNHKFQRPEPGSVCAIIGSAAAAVCGAEAGDFCCGESEGDRSGAAGGV